MTHAETAMLLSKLVDEQIIEITEDLDVNDAKLTEERIRETEKEITEVIDRLLRERLCTGERAISAILRRAADDTDFATHLEVNPEEALSGYVLTFEERLAIDRGDIDRIEQWVGKLDSHLSRWLRARRYNILESSADRDILKGLHLVDQHVAMGIDHLPSSRDLQNLVAGVTRQAEYLSQLRDKATAVKQATEELSSIDMIINKYCADGSALIQILLEVQQKYRYLPQYALKWVSQRLDVPLARIYQIATFYKVFSLVPQGRHIVQVCMGTACQVRGASQLLEKVTEILKIQPGETDSDRRFTLTTVNCLGCCAMGPVMMVDDEYYSKPSWAEIKEIVAEYR